MTPDALVSLGNTTALACWLLLVRMAALPGVRPAGRPLGAQDAAARQTPPWLVAPCLLLTFIFGPAGWLAYALLRRTQRTRTY